MLLRALLALLAATLLAAATWLGHALFYTEAGLRFAVEQLRRVPGVTIDVEGAGGRLAGPLSIDTVTVDHAAVHVVARQLRLEPRLRQLLLGTVTLRDVAVGSLVVRVKERQPPPETEPGFLPAWLRVAVRNAAIRDVALVLPGDRRVHVARVNARLVISRWRLDLPAFAVEDPAGRVDGALTLRATQPLGLRGQLAGHWRLPDGRDYAFSGDVRGSLARLATSVELTSPARLSFSGAALALDTAPRVVGTLRAQDVDGSPWLAPGTLPKLSGSIALDAGREAIGIDGTLSSAVFGDGPLRLQGGGRVDGSRVEIASLRAWLPRLGSTVKASGTVTLGGERPDLALDAEWSQLRWPLTGEPVVESAAGRGRLTGRLPYAFEVDTQSRGPAIPAAAWRARGSIDREQLAIDALDGEVLSGRLAASGRLAWSATQPWQVRIDGQSLDLSQLRPDLPGRVSIAGTLEGVGLAADAPWTARLTRVSGTLLGRALTGQGEVAFRDGEYRLRDLRIANGRSRVALDGRWGPQVDLRWNASLATLALLQPGLAGRLESSGTLRGRPDAVRVTGDARSGDVRYDSLFAAGIDAAFDVDLTGREPSRIDVRARDVDLGTLQVGSVELLGEGPLQQHAVTLRARSEGTADGRVPPLRLALELDGRYVHESRSWSGRLHRAEVAFRDGSAALLQPAALAVSPERASLAPLCIATPDDARLCAEGEWQARPAEWRLLYSAQDWPLRSLLTTLLGRRDFDGRLQASGWISQQPGREWVGGTTVLLDDPVLLVPRNKFRTERLELEGGQLDLYAEPGTLRAEVDFKLGAATRIEGRIDAERHGGDWAGFPVRGRLEGNSGVLTALPLLVPEIDRSSGRLQGVVGVSGTLGAPRLDGNFQVRDGSFALYRTNLVLDAVALDGTFVGDELRFSGGGTTRKGALRLDGHFTWPGGVMTGEMRLQGDGVLLADTPELRIVASPDLLFRAADGLFDVEGEILIPTAKIAPKDLRTSVSTSPDERIVGLEAGPAAPSTLQRVRARVRVVLGDDVRVDSYGLKARLGGEVTVLLAPDDVARGEGAIRVLEGRYKAFGQDVRITKGVLAYERTPLDDPRLDLTAERQFEEENIVVAVNVRGSLGAPFVTISSTPAMSTNEALSYLLTGRSIDTLQSGQATSIDKAAESLALSGGGLLLGGLGRRIGIDEVSVESDADEEASVVLGKYLTPRLFVSYGISIAEAINTVKLRYTLNERWSLRAEAGVEQSADVEYRIER